VLDDEVLVGAAVRATGRIAITGELTVRYVKPVPLETPLVGSRRMTARHDRYVDVEGALEERALLLSRVTRKKHRPRHRGSDSAPSRAPGP